MYKSFKKSDNTAAKLPQLICPNNTSALYFSLK